MSDFKIKKYNASEFGLEKIHRVRFWIKNFSTCQILKNCLHSKITFCFILLHENDIFYVLWCFFKNIFLNWKFHYVSGFELKKIQRVRFWNEKNKRVTFWNEIFSSCQISNQLFTTRQVFKRNILPKSTTGFFHIAFLHKTIYNYMLQYLRQLDNSIRHRSNNTSCTFYCMDFLFWFRFSVPLYSQFGLDICRNLLLLVKIMISILQMSHTCLTSFWKRLW